MVGETCERELPLASPQRALWVAYTLDPADPTYNLGYSVRVRTPLSPDDVRAISRTLVTRHPQLAAVFAERDGVPTQRVDRTRDVDFAAVDLRGLDDAARAERMARDHAAPFDLRAGPPARFRQYQLDDGVSELALHAHHIVLDGWGGQLLVDELLLLVAGFAATRAGTSAPPLPPPPVATYGDFVAAERAYLASPRAERAAAHFKEILGDDVGPVPLPVDGAPAAPRHGAADIRRTLGGDAAQRARALARTLGATPFALFLAAWAMALARLTDTRDVVVSAPMLNRPTRPLKGVVGHFANLTPLRVHVDAAAIVRDVVVDVGRALREGLRHQGYPFARALDHATADRSAFPNVSFAWTDVQRSHVDATTAAAAGVDVESQRITQLGTHADLVLTVYPRPHDFVLELRFDRGALAPETASSFLDALVVALDAAAAAPDALVGALPLVGPVGEARVGPTRDARGGADVAACLPRLDDEVARARGARGSVATWPALVIDADAVGASLAVTDRGGRVLPRGAEGALVVVMGGGRGADAVVSTGYAGRVRVDGVLEVRGRLARRGRVRGVRVPLDRVEDVLRTFPGVVDAAVLTVPDDAHAHALHAVVTPRVDPAALARFVDDALPPWARPGRIDVEDALPRTAAGEPDVAALRARAARPTGAPRSFVGARTDTERALVEIVDEVTGLGALSVEENLLALGLDSLAAAQVLARVQHRFGCDVRLAGFFASPTVSALAALVESAPRRTLAPIIVDDGPGAGARPADARLSSGQERMWFQHRLDPEGVAYSMPAAIRVRGPIDLVAFERAYYAVVERHPTLRTTFPVVGGTPVQRVGSAAAAAYAVVDLRGEGEGALERAKELANAEASAHFDLEHGPIVRLLVLPLADDDAIAVLNMHHIISDQWSHGVLFRELTIHYRAYVSGLARVDVPPAIHFATAARWLDDRLRAGALDDDIAWWRARLAGMPELDLPTDFPRPPARTSRGHLTQLDLEPALIDDVKATAAERRATPFMVLLAAYVAVLARTARATDFGVGVPMAGRARVELEGVIGPFVNTIAIRAALDEELTFDGLLARVREASIEAFLRQEVPFERVVEAVAPPRDPSRTPLVQVMFNLGNTPIEDEFPDGLSWEIFDLAIVGAQFDLSLAVDLETTKRAGLIASADLFTPATSRRILRQWRTMLEAALAAPDARVADVELLDEDERRYVLETLNATALAYPRDETVLDGFLRVVAAHPEKTALVVAGRETSYAALDARACAIAGALAGAGVGDGDIVGIVLRRSEDLVASLLACFRLGAAYLPVDPGYPSDRVAYVLEDAQAKALVVGPGLDDVVRGFAGRIVRPADISTSAEASVSPRARAEGRAYVIYTSGSTGRPKGVAVGQRALMNFVASMQREPGFTSRDTILAVTSVSFDIHGLEVFVPLVSGGTILLADEADVVDGGLLRRHLDGGRVTVMQATPASWRLLLLAGWTGTPGLKILCGGEAFPPELVAPLLERAAELWNMYGPTETTIWSAVARVTRPENPVPIGHPIANTQLYVLDDGRRPVSPGIPGELYIAGDGVAEGYLHRPELTAERFLPNPFVDDAGPRMYRTGDLARVRPDGAFECLGRVDAQVKLFGFRIEPGEIEKALAEVAGIRASAVVVRKGPQGTPSLVAFVVLDHGAAAPSLIDVRAALSRTLPAYMIPRALVVLDALPLTPNGKVDRRTLAMMDVGRASSTEERKARPPRDELEERVAAHWRRLLPGASLDIDESFFDAGGQSITGAELMIALSDELGVDLPLRLLFQQPTIAGLASLARERQASPPPSTDLAPSDFRLLFPVQPAGTRPPLFLVAGAHQRGLLYGTYEEDLMRYLAAVIPALGLDQPIYGFRPLGLFRDEEPHQSVEEMAQAYVEELKAARPHGPYRIGGECVGGYVAYEMARQLRARGDDVEALVLLDTVRPTRARLVKETLWFVALKLRYDWAATRARRRERGEPTGTLSALVDAARAVRYALRHGGLARLARGTDLYYFMTLMRYQAHRYDGLVHLVVNAEDHARDPTLGWTSDLAPHLDVHVVPGTHVTRLSEYGDTTGRAIREALDGWSRGAGAPPRG